MENDILNFYQYAFSNLKIDRSKGVAPHKPILLLSVIQAIETGLIVDSQIAISPELIEIFKTNWNTLVTSNHVLGFALPFYHLKNEKGGWWELIPKPGCEIWLQNSGSMRTFGNLNAAVAYAEIDANLVELLKSEPTRSKLRQCLLQTYFPNFSSAYFIQKNSYLADITRDMLEETPSVYQVKLKTLQTKLDPETYQIEVYSRDARANA